MAHPMLKQRKNGPTALGQVDETAMRSPFHCVSALAIISVATLCGTSNSQGGSAEMALPSANTSKTFRGSDVENTCIEIMTEEPAKALTLLKQVEADYESESRYFTVRAACYLVLGLEEPCLREIELALILASSEQDKADAFHIQGKMLNDVGNFAVLERTAEKAVAVIPNDPQEWVYLATAYQQQGKFHKSVKAARTALRLNPDKTARTQASYVLANSLGSSATDADSQRETILAADVALSCELNEVPRGIVHLIAGRAAAQMRDFESAERHFRSALKAPDQQLKELVFTALAESYFDQKQERRVVTLLTDAVRQFPNNVDYWRKLSIAHARLNNVEQATAASKRWKQLDPSAPN